MNGCEPNERELRTLQPGAAFEMTLTHTTGVRGIVVKHLAGSTLVDCGGAKQEHWCYDCPVVPHLEVTDTESWIKSNQTEDTMPGAKKERKPKLKRVIRFEIGKKAPLEKYLDEKNTAYSALMYRAIKKAKDSITFADIYAEIERSVANKTEGKTPKATLSVILQKMVKDGFVARSEVKE